MTSVPTGAATPPRGQRHLGHLAFNAAHGTPQLQPCRDAACHWARPLHRTNPRRNSSQPSCNCPPRNTQSMFINDSRTASPVQSIAGRQSNPMQLASPIQCRPTAVTLTAAITDPGCRSKWGPSQSYLSSNLISPSNLIFPSNLISSPPNFFVVAHRRPCAIPPHSRNPRDCRLWRAPRRRTQQLLAQSRSARKCRATARRALHRPFASPKSLRPSE